MIQENADPDVVLDLADFFETIVAPTLRQKNPDARRAASQALADLAVTSRKFKQALLRSNLRDNLQSA